MVQKIRLEDIIEGKKIIFHCGKGGTGKTVSSIAVAHLASNSGKRVLVLGVDAAERLPDFIEVGVGHTPTMVNNNLDAMVIDTKTVFDELLHEYGHRLGYSDERIRDVQQGPFYRLINNYFPGLQEFMAMGKIKMLLDTNQYELIVVDLPPKGQGERFLNLSTSLKDTLYLVKIALKARDAWVYLGNNIKSITKLFSRQKLKEEAPFDISGFLDIVQKEVEQLDYILKERSQSLFSIVASPDKATINETVQLYRIVKNINIPIGYIIMNFVEPGLREEHAGALDRLLSTPEHLAYLDESASKLGYNGLISALSEGARVIEDRKKFQCQSIEALRYKLNLIKSAPPIFIVPIFPSPDKLPDSPYIFAEYLKNPAI